MVDYSNVSSEQELQQLRDDGKITDGEYEQLRDAMQVAPQNSGQAPESAPKQKSKKKLAIIGFCLMLVGFTLPFLLYYIIEQIVQASDPNVSLALWPWLLMGVVLEITALTIGIIAWPEPFAKATVIWIGILIVLGVLAYFKAFSSSSALPDPGSELV
jgi:hypothetical protein